MIDEETIRRAEELRNAGELIPIGQGRSEAQIAAEYRARTLKMLEEIANLLTEARKEHSMTISFQIGGPDSFGRYALTMLEVTKKLC